MLWTFIFIAIIALEITAVSWISNDDPALGIGITDTMQYMAWATAAVWAVVHLGLWVHVRCRVLPNEAKKAKELQGPHKKWSRSDRTPPLIPTRPRMTQV